MLEERITAGTVKNDIAYVELTSIVRSASPQVREQLSRIVQQTSHPTLYVIGMKSLPEADTKPLEARAHEILAGLPADTGLGFDLLTYVIEREPEKAESTLNDFLKPGQPCVAVPCARYSGRVHHLHKRSCYHSWTTIVRYQAIITL